MTDPTPIVNPIWMAPMWKPVRPYALSWIEVTLGEGDDPLPGTPITVQLVIADDPKNGTNAGYFTIAEAVLAASPRDRRAVAEVEQPFGPRIIPAGWWVACCHDCDWDPGSGRAPTLSLQPHGTNL